MRTILLLLVFSVCNSTNLLGSTTWIVDDDGQDHPSPHFATIQEAVDIASSGDEIFVYEIHSDGLQSVSEDILDPEMIDPDFFLPRDLGYQREYGVPYIYAITSNNAGNSTRDSRLWRINLNNPDNMEFVDLTASAFGINNAEVDGLTIHNGIAYISYDTSGFSSEADQVQKGILKLRISSFQSKGIWNLFSGKPYRTMETAKFQTRNSQFRGGRKKAPQSAFTPVAPKTKFSINKDAIKSS